MNRKEIVWRISKVMAECEEDHTVAALQTLVFQIVRSGRHKGSTVSDPLRQLIKVRDNLTCFHCGQKGNEAFGPDGQYWHMDHLIPLSRGGETTATNVVLSCSTCNVARLDSVSTRKPPPLMIEDSQPVAPAEPKEGKWDEFVRGFFEENPTARQIDLRLAMAAMEEREPEALKSEAFRQFHKYSPNGDRSKAQ